MGIESVSRTIQFILAPAVMISACAIVLGGLLGRYSSISDRLRALVKERLELVRVSRVGKSEDLTLERIREIDAQLPDLLHRHKLAHDAVLILYCAVLIFILTMLVIALALQVNSDLASLVALGIFLIGMATLALSVALTIAEVLISQRAVTYEVREIASLKYQPEPEKRGAI